MGAFLNAYARRAVYIGQEGIALFGGTLGGFHKLVAFGGPDGTATEGAHKHGHHHLGIVDARLKGHAAALGSCLFLRGGDAVAEVGEVQGIARLDFTVEFKDRTSVKDVSHIPFRFHREVVAAMAAHARELGKEIRPPQVKTSVGRAVGAGDRAVNLVPRGYVVPLEAARIVRPGGKGHEFLGLAVLLAGQLVGEFVPGGQQATLENFPFVVHFFHKGADAPLMLAVKVVLEADPGLGDPVPGGSGQLGDKGPAVARGLA